MSGRARQLINDLDGGRVATASELTSRLSRLSAAEADAVGRTIYARSWIGWVDLIRLQSSTNNARAECSRAGGNPDDPATARRMAPVVATRPTMLSVAHNVIERARR